MISLLWCQGHVMAYVGFPTMLGMNDVIYLVVICKFLMYPLLVGSMDVCIESFGDRKVPYDVQVLVLLKNIFCRSCLQSGGACFSTAKQRDQHVLRGSTALCP